MRTIEDHKTNPANETLAITVQDEPGQGGASHRYAIHGFSGESNPSKADWDHASGDRGCLVLFQNGPIKEFGVNGVTQEALLAIVIDRLRSFQAGPFACAENGLALTHCEAALTALKSRTLARMQRGVEGTHQK